MLVSKKYTAMSSLDIRHLRMFNNFNENLRKEIYYSLDENATKAEVESIIENCWQDRNC